MGLLNDAVFYVLDTETTGLDPEVDAVVEVACTVIQPKEGLYIWSSLVNPNQEIPPEASAIHHITNHHVLTSPTLTTALQEFGKKLERDRIPTPPDAYVAHNAEFDADFLPMLRKAPWLCTLRLAKHLFQDLPKYTNQFLRYYFNIYCPEVEGKAAHRAEADAIVTARLLKFMLTKLPDDWPNTVEDLIDRINQPILLRTCRYKKHDGTPWAEVPKDYLLWLLKNKTDMDIDTHFTVDHYYKLGEK